MSDHESSASAATEMSNRSRSAAGSDHKSNEDSRDGNIEVYETTRHLNCCPGILSQNHRHCGNGRHLRQASTKLEEIQRDIFESGNTKSAEQIQECVQLIFRHNQREDEMQHVPNVVQYRPVTSNDYVALFYILIIILLIATAVYVPLEVNEFPDWPALEDDHGDTGNPVWDVVYGITGVLYLVVNLPLLYYGRKNSVYVFGILFKVPETPKTRTTYPAPNGILGNESFTPVVCWDEPKSRFSCCAPLLDTVRYNAFYYVMFTSSAVILVVLEALRCKRISLIGVVVEWFIIIITILSVATLTELRGTDSRLLKASVKSFSFVYVVILLVVHCVAGIVETYYTGEINDPLAVMDNLKTYLMFVWINLFLFLTDAIDRPPIAQLAILFITVVNSGRILMVYYFIIAESDVHSLVDLNHVTPIGVRIWTVILLTAFYLKCIFTVLFSSGSSVIIRRQVETHFDYA